MKKLVALLLVAMMLCTCMAALAETPEGYPEVVEGLDFGGAKVYFYDYWSQSSKEPTQNPTAETEARDAYRAWLMETYNVDIEAVALSDWGGILGAMTDIYGAGADVAPLATFSIPPDFVGGPLSQNILLAWNDWVDLDNETRWVKSTSDFMNLGGQVYGVTPNNPEPRGMVYFNKRILEDAGIDWESIYDMQADGTWTWDVFEQMLEKVQKDTDNDGIVDIWGLTGSNVDMYRLSVVSAGASFFAMDDETGAISVAVSQETLDALAWSKRIFETYFFQGVTDESGNAPVWNYYVDAWNQAVSGFYVAQGYQGFNTPAEMDALADEWGMVAFPVREAGSKYVYVASDNVTLMLDLYDAETAKKIATLYELWTNPTPGYDDSDAWALPYYDKNTDERAIEESYAMLREPDRAIFDPALKLGSINDVEGADFLWNLSWQTPQEIYDAKIGNWESLVNEYNAKYVK